MQISATATQGKARKSIGSKEKWTHLHYLANACTKLVLLFLELQELGMRAASKPTRFAMFHSFYLP